MPRVFLSFRKRDSRWMRERVFSALSDRLGADEVFQSGRSIPPGADFAGILLSRAADCKLMCVLIGPGWIDARDTDGTRLLDRPHDWVRREIATALRAGNRVVPVLLGDATMLPDASALPAEIAELGRLQFLRVPETHLTEGLADLGDALAALLPPGPAAGRDAEPAADPLPATTMTAHVHGGGSAYQAARDQTIRFT
ncbi:MULTISPECIES: toll/interleukin-1 receptor domain-containing protein [Streptomyces]|uniref:toll/interleukin-1 receptor domain-containing protein n=1 Tax=Streptomyces TaxID=1883 RepID=UPI0015C443D2|nr:MULTISPECIES: toll/interleukin-1 receptor domain-containing protein [Streptomyces]MBK0371979.1 toll/interleukin-1 receptor domain-containing protein [Streptomyces sp. RB110-1]MBK0385304.1 toll/interleukin-1 receptor domain-containing protein [Streptomyces sp. RB110-2]MCF3171606.1 toll/interleukin-1 receptor domain-containing protein [Streptomyces violaceoruber]QLG35702.1 toll/interleukin-1 receptor domain-containing protein [Streptomyces sp. CB04723]